MKSVVLAGPNQDWKLIETDIPKPGRNKVLIKTRATGICYTDIHITNGISSEISYPLVPGHEVVGEIAEIGQDVENCQIGDRVGVPCMQSYCNQCEMCRCGKSIFCANQTATGINTPGGLAEYMLSSSEAIVSLPNQLSYTQAAPIFCAGYTAWGALSIADPKPNERVAILGVGGLGHMAIQYSKAYGLETVAITHSRDKEELCYRLGADYVLSEVELLKQTSGADIVLATTNSYKDVNKVLSGLRPDGRLVLVGRSKDPLFITEDIITNRLRILGSKHNGRKYLYQAIDFATTGKVKAIVERYSIDDISHAYQKVTSGEIRFRAVIHFED